MNFPLEGINQISPNELRLKIIDSSKNFIFIQNNQLIRQKKEEIDKLENIDNWDKMKKIGNPYELIYTSYNKKRKNDSISSYIPISRSYFKLWEIFYNFELFKDFGNEQSFIFSHLAEGPGGFMEASYNYMKKNNKNNNYYYGITLKPHNEYVPDWNKIKKIFDNDKKVQIDYGNLYIFDDVLKYVKKFEEKKAHFVTADGGFDYSNDFNGQELNSCQIIYSEIVVALNVLRKNGCFVVKVFDLFSITSCQFFAILTSHFRVVNIYKPETSRPANSEKYLVCQGFLDNISTQQKYNYLLIIKLWYELQNKLPMENSSFIFQSIKVNNQLIHLIAKYNELYVKKQLHYLDNTIKITQNKPSKEEYYQIIKNQVATAIKWCQQYHVSINTNSIYYKKNY
jgi:23S rRNA U2552 (ribose-2'-O)-methylase RlmE/FtsJ